MSITRDWGYQVDETRLEKALAARREYVRDAAKAGEWLDAENELTTAEYMEYQRRWEREMEAAQREAEEIYLRWLGTRFDRPEVREAFMDGYRMGSSGKAELERTIDSLNSELADNG